ncbi:MAG: 2-C-methyl-D-erythritol 2,4-cyclodiphosphate synthase [Lachnospiraceae bacterium]|nr:2-C-methyl-D-erythritol 2,4-cyclodiphosphate synthase [Lachnospiraceae bacterium]
MRIGTGYDVHRLGPDRKLIVGGVEIPYELGLVGHSDADVLLHAIMDALLGAAALGDIGKHFPDTDEKYRGISSLKLLAHVADLLEENHFIIENIDATIIAQRPKMRPYIDTMRENIAKTLGIEISQVNVKATTEEGLGFTGSGEGISSQAVCLLYAVDELCEDSVPIGAGRDCAGCSGCPAADTGKASKKYKKEKKKDKKKAKKKDGK